jgi:hypothetical protein
VCYFVIGFTMLACTDRFKQETNANKLVQWCRMFMLRWWGHVAFMRLLSCVIPPWMRWHRAGLVNFSTPIIQVLRYNLSCTGSSPQVDVSTPHMRWMWQKSSRMQQLPLQVIAPWLFRSAFSLLSRVQMWELSSFILSRLQTRQHVALAGKRMSLCSPSNASLLRHFIVITLCDAPEWNFKFQLTCFTGLQNAEQCVLRSLQWRMPRFCKWAHRRCIMVTLPWTCHCYWNKTLHRSLKSLCQVQAHWTQCT